MRKIVYTKPDGMVAVCSPVEGARLALSVTLADETVLKAKQPMPVDAFLRRWPVLGAAAEWAETEMEFAQRIAAKDVPADATEVHVVDAAAIPTDRTFRNAWKISVDAPAGQPPFAVIEHDMAKCKAIAHERRRARRAEEFAPLDIEATIPAKATQAEAARQAIRDKYDAMQAAIDAATSVEEIKVVLA